MFYQNQGTFESRKFSHHSYDLIPLITSVQPFYYSNAVIQSNNNKWLLGIYDKKIQSVFRTVKVTLLTEYHIHCVWYHDKLDDRDATCINFLTTAWVVIMLDNDDRHSVEKISRKKIGCSLWTVEEEGKD